MRLLPFAVAVLSLAFAPAPFPKSRPSKDTSDLARMQGTWTVVEPTLSGRSVLREPTQIKITGTRFEFIVSGEVRSRWEMKLDPTASPRVMDRTSLATQRVGGGNVLLCIYRFQGEQLHILYTTSGARPTAFDSNLASGYLTI